MRKKIGQPLSEKQRSNKNSSEIQTYYLPSSTSIYYPNIN